MVSPDSPGTACPLSGRNSTYRPVQISDTSSDQSVCNRRGECRVLAQTHGGLVSTRNARSAFASSGHACHIGLGSLGCDSGSCSPHWGIRSKPVSISGMCLTQSNKADQKSRLATMHASAASPETAMTIPLNAQRIAESDVLLERRQGTH
jgi:hypothetical protein